MPDILQQKLQDSEESYLNTSSWAIQPLFHFIQNGEMENLRNRLDIHLEQFPAGRITRDARKQLEYLTVSLINTFMIAAIMGGVFPPDANGVADAALRRLSTYRHIENLPAIIYDAAIHLCRLVIQTRQTDTGNAHVEAAKHYLAANLTQEIHMDEVAKAVGISQYHLSRLFKAKTGQTMREYLVHERIDAAKQLLTDDTHTIPQIAALLHFCDQSYFIKVFREQTGVTPNRYREENRQHQGPPAL